MTTDLTREQIEGLVNAARVAKNRLWNIDKETAWIDKLAEALEPFTQAALQAPQFQPAPPSDVEELSPLDKARLATQQEVEDGDLTVEDFDKMERHQWNKALEAAARIADREEKTYESGDLHEAATNARYIAYYIRELRR